MSLDHLELNRGAGGKKVAGYYLDTGFVQLIGTGMVLTDNSTTTVLTSGQTYTGTWRDVSMFDSVMVACKSDVAGTLYIEFSTDASNADSILSYDVAAATNEVHRASITRQYFRARYVNNGTNQTYFRLQAMAGVKQMLASPINTVVQTDADAQTVRAITEETLISEGKYQGRTIVNKFGRNSDVDSGTLPEDIWNGGGTYTGFPTGTPEVLEVFSSSASDTGDFTFTYLPSNTATEYLTATVTLTGTTPVNTGITVYRMHTANYASGTATGFNVGDITARHRVTTANVFCVMPAGRSQTYVSAYTVPAGSTGRIVRLFCRLLSNTTASVEGALWIRALNGSPRMRRPFTVGNADSFQEMPYGGLILPAGTDVIVRIVTATASNLDVIGGYDMVLVADD